MIATAEHVLKSEIELTADVTVYHPVEVREKVMATFGVREKNWYYHVGRLPQPEAVVGRRRWYTEKQVNEMMRFFAGLKKVRENRNATCA